MSIKKIIVGTILIVAVVFVFALLTQTQIKQITWDEATKLFANCQIESADQSQNLEITLSLIDGSVAKTRASAITSLGEQISQNTSTCGEVNVTTTGY